MPDPREALDELIRTRGEDYASLSRLLGRNAAYIQQFIRRGVPRKLDEEDRRTLARYFRIDEAVLGGPAAETAAVSSAISRLMTVPRYDVSASAGPGGHADDDPQNGLLGFDERYLRTLTANPARLSGIRVQGDSMVPTLGDGDDILVDTSDAAERLRDGIYVLRYDDALNVKRLSRAPDTGRLSVRSDNLAYPAWPDCDPAQLQIIGRVVWVGRRVS